VRTLRLFNTLKVAYFTLNQEMIDHQFWPHPHTWYAVRTLLG
jgi:hypothetical protein